MITLDTMAKLSSQIRHMDILEDRLLDSLEQLKKMRAEQEELIVSIIKEERE